MVKVYFETSGHAEHVATFESEEIYIACLKSLEKHAKANNFEKVTESMGEPETTYYLIGDDAVRELNNEGFDGLLKDIEENNTCYSVFAFEEGITKSAELAEALDGWENYAIITKEEYDQL